MDRIVHDSNEHDEKLNNMANNPVKAGLARQIEDYPVGYCNQELVA